MENDLGVHGILQDSRSGSVSSILVIYAPYSAGGGQASEGGVEDHKDSLVESDVSTCQVHNEISSKFLVLNIVITVATPVNVPLKFCNTTNYLNR